MMRVLGGVLWGAVASYGLLTALGLAGVLLLRVDLAWVEYGKSALLLALWASPLLLLLVVLLRRWRLAALSLPAVVGLTLYVVPYLLPKSVTPPPNAQTFTVLSYNILEQFEGLDEAVAVIRAVDADIVLLQELSDYKAAGLGTLLGDLYPYHALHPQTGRYNYFRGQGILSRYPITEDEYWQYDDLPESHGHQRAVIDLDGQALVIYNVHPWPPVGWVTGLHFYFLPEEDLSHRETVRRLLTRIDAEPPGTPLVMAGDFNMTDQSEEYRAVTQRLSDSQRTVGQGLGLTYPADGVLFLPALIRIDYVFYGGPLLGLDAGTWPEAGVSDHLPVWARLALP